MAEETPGRTYTGIEWYFHHFGPYSSALIDDLDFLSTQPSVEKEDIKGKDKEYSLYGLGAWVNVKTLEELRLPPDVRLRLSDAIRKFSRDLSGLLDFVYFKTEPMQGVLPGSRLSFDDLHKVNYRADIKNVKVPISGAKKISRIQTLLLDIGRQWEDECKSQELKNPPIRDALFEQSVADEDLISAQGIHAAKLSFHGNNE
jgi:hypothetical protein